jgi:hypothetical protein
VTGAERRRLPEEVSCRQGAAYRLLVYALITDRIEPSVAMRGASRLLQRARMFFDVLAAGEPRGRAG